jgi:hypothetical protein
MIDDLPRGVRFCARLIPAGDREWILGDLVEAADDRGLRGVHRRWWLASECAAMAAGLSVDRARGWFVKPSWRDLAVGVVVDGRVAVRGGAGTLVTALLVCGSIAGLAIGVEILVSSLLTAGF